MKRKMKRKKILVFSGAGVSQESGVETFRGLSGGLWNNYDVRKVADIRAWREDPQTVIDFYNLRRRDMERFIPIRLIKLFLNWKNGLMLPLLLKI